MQKNKVIAEIEKLGGKIVVDERVRASQWSACIFGMRRSAMPGWLPSERCLKSERLNSSIAGALATAGWRASTDSPTSDIFVWMEPASPTLDCVDFATLPQLQTLVLAGTAVSDAGLAKLSGMVQLQWLDLGFTKVTDAGMERLKGLNRLQWLDLPGTKVTDAGLTQLQGLVQLQGINLKLTGATDTSWNVSSG